MSLNTGRRIPSHGVDPDGAPVKAARARRLVGLLACGLLVILAACRAAPPPDDDREPAGALHLRVIAMHDFHGALRATVDASSEGRRVGGAPALKALMDGLEADCACPTVRVDGGDQMQGTLDSNLAWGASVVAAFNHLGLDAAAIGNHELDWGVETFRTRQREAQYAWLAANVYQVENGERPAWAPPYVVMARDGVRIGVVGYATVSTPRSLRPDVTAPYDFRPGYAGIRDALDAVWRERPDFVVVVAHADGECTTEGCTGEMVQLASELPQGLVHLIAGGHDHSAGSGIVNGIPIVRAGSNGRAVAVVDLFRLENGTHAFGMSRHTVYADAVKEDAGMVALLAPYLAEADRRGRTIVTTLAEPLSSAATGDRRLGLFIAESVRLRAAADVGLHNPGGVRADLPRGPISYGDVHRVLPFDEIVVRLTLTGRQLRELAAQTGTRYYYANLRIEQGDPHARGSGRVNLTLADGTPVRDEQSYTLATTEFLADGGDGLALLASLPQGPLGVTVLDAVVDRLRTLPTPVSLPEEQPRDRELQQP